MIKFMGYILSSTINIAVFTDVNKSYFVTKSEEFAEYKLIEFCSRCVIVEFKNQKLRLYAGDGITDNLSEKNNSPSDKFYIDKFTDENPTVYIGRETIDYFSNSGLVAALYSAASSPSYDWEGVQLGYRIYEIDKGSIFDLMGFQDYDLLTSINGIQLSNPFNSIKALQSLKTLDTFEVSMIRYGTNYQLQFFIK